MVLIGCTERYTKIGENLKFLLDDLTSEKTILVKIKPEMDSVEKDIFEVIQVKGETFHAYSEKEIAILILNLWSNLLNSYPARLLKLN